MEVDITDNYELAGMAMDETIEHLERELKKIRAGKANPSMLYGIMVEYYGSPTPIKQVATISSLDARSLNITPWDKKNLPAVEKAIFAANLGLTPQNDGENIRINIPPLTEERRRSLVKQIKALAEEGKVSLRSVRHKSMDVIKKAVKNGYPEDAGKREEAKIESLVKNYSQKIEELQALKEKDIMTV